MAAMMFVLARFLLMPFVLIAVTLFAMASHIVGTALHHQFAWHQAVATVTAVSPYTETQKNGLITKGINVAIAYVAFGETIDIWTWIGALIIFASAVYITRREAQLRRQAARLGVPPRT